ncbi:MAG: DUF58 domain-containing protein [Phycisphaerales bacterium]|nr:MAG: DUF58 domain-containing protein [Phycisphaerales bacterium]
MRLGLGLTDAGKVILRGTGLVAVAALIFPAFGVLSALVSVVLTALLVGFILRPKIRVSGSLPDRVIAGQTARLRYVLKNVANLPVYNLRVRFDALPESIEQLEGEHVVSHLRPGETREVTIAIRPKRRGCYQIARPACQSSFPFNLFSFGTPRGEEETLVVLPVFSRLQMPLRHLSPHVRANGAKLAGRTAVSAEYVGNRPFVPGDSPRRIDARAWARLSVPATKEYHDDSDNSAALVVDTDVHKVSSGSTANEIKELEAAISLCASVAFTINDHCLIDLLLTGPNLHEFTGRPRTGRLDRMYEILARAEPSKSYSLRQIAPILADRFYEISQIVFILLNWDRAYRRLLELASQAGCHSTVLLVTESDGTHVDEDSLSRDDKVRLLSPDEILTGRIRRL